MYLYINICIYIDIDIWIYTVQLLETDHDSSRWTTDVLESCTLFIR